MGQWIALQSRSGEISAWRAEPVGPPLGALVVVQEIFGVNGHIRSVVDRFAEAGYSAIAPALFDHFEPRVELGYDKDGVEADEVAAKVTWMMDSDGGKVLRERALAAMKQAQQALREGGESDVTLARLVDGWML